MVKIHYLNWNKENRERNHDDQVTGPAGELFHKLSVKDVLDEDEKPGNSYTEDEFNDLYREVADLDYNTDNPEELWDQWNLGSGHESQEFYDAQVRSMSIGDIVEIDGTYYRAEAIGFEEVTIEGGEQ